MKFLVINGPNINMLGIREPDVYGKNSYSDLLAFIRESASNAGVEAELFQSNSEGAIIDIIQWAYGKFDGIVINPAAYTHTSIAILDALKAVALPAVEVHLSDINSREDFRRHSYISAAWLKTIAGKGFDGYKEAIEYLSTYITEAAE
ncbi:MAG: type II 3-dehydroquinate dehydratase [Clostridiales bacterium]|nr:type II 3-dehydroquinate dehydratase [Clostridiales bacterium]